MPNSYFQFKQFTIQQDKCAMKVCTDSCIFGSWLANHFADCKSSIAHCLDIGTGTALLSLLLAQKTNFKIDAIEIEENAFEQAKENFENSPWSKKLNVVHGDVKQFSASKKYDLIICNPPFFEKELISPQTNKNIAKHNTGLTLKEFVEVIKHHLNTNGCFAVLLPYQRIKYFEDLAIENNFFLTEKLLIKQTPSHNFFRGILFLESQPSLLNIRELTIKDSDRNYTKGFEKLMKDYYL